MIDCSPTSLAIWLSVSGVIAKPQLLTTCAAEATTSAVPAGASTAIGLFMAKYTPGSMIQAETSAIIATKDSINIPP
ncbi:Uncharacterised protein [Shigella sonnei]|nr:Uncharacterised protein [Shigella sonnei]